MDVTRHYRSGAQAAQAYKYETGASSTSGLEQGQVRPPGRILHVYLVASASGRSAPVARSSSCRSAPCRSASSFLPPTTPDSHWYRRESGNTPPEELKAPAVPG